MSKRKSSPQIASVKPVKINTVIPGGSELTSVNSISIKNAPNTTIPSRTQPKTFRPG